MNAAPTRGCVPWTLTLVLLIWAIFIGVVVAAHAGVTIQYPRIQPPPARYRADATHTVLITNRIAALCGNPDAYSCFQYNTVYLPNPCLFPADFYATLACHEFGHANGWPSTHPEN